MAADRAPAAAPRAKRRGKAGNAEQAPIDYRGIALKGLFIAAAAFAGYLLLVVVPFFAHGLHAQPVHLVQGGSFDPKELAPFTIPVVGWLLYMLAASLFALAPLASMALVVLGLAAAASEPKRTARNRLVWFIPTATGIGWWFFMVSPIGSLIGTWFAD